MDHLDAVVSDLSALHRVRRWKRMPAPRFLRYARQLMHYRGAVRGAAMAELAREQGAGERSPAGYPQDDPQTVDSAVAPIHPGFAGDAASGFPPVFEVRKAGQ